MTGAVRWPLAWSGVTEAFLARRLGGRYQPIGTDLAGSSHKVETGGELVPGLSGYELRLAQRKMRAAKCHHGAEAQRRQSG